MTTRMPCEAPNCGNPGTMTLVAARARHSICDKTLCTEHTNEFWKQFPMTYCGDIEKSWNAEVVAFDLEVVICDWESGFGYFYLHESLGDERVFLPMRCGLFEAMACIAKLRQTSFRRPPTHDSMLGVIQAMGGTLRSVVIDTFDIANKWFEAKLEIVDRTGQDCIVDVRPSDAVPLALAADLPIVISVKVLRDFKWERR